MIFDKTLLFSDAQAMGHNTVSTNVIDLAPVGSGLRRDVGKGRPVPILIQVVDAYEINGNLSFDVEVAVNETFLLGKKVVARTAPAHEALLKPGYVFSVEFLPRGTDERYLRLVCIASGQIKKQGKITAGITMGNQSNG